jgi:hypothetical protein
MLHRRGSELSKLIIKKKALLKNVIILKSNYYTDGLRSESECEDSSEDISEDSSDDSVGFPRAVDSIIAADLRPGPTVNSCS